eukprot:snap_masked-scaffold415_size178368-processed-gene-0.19 protein:Tk01182 transcript:snap_masked-scaffold415_size178368-processed-gene-0.19-mRNA-1 annotation:"tumor necrosis factor alpha-induced protein 3 isoform x2"
MNDIDGAMIFDKLTDSTSEKPSRSPETLPKKNPKRDSDGGNNATTSHSSSSPELHSTPQEDLLKLRQARPLTKKVKRKLNGAESVLKSRSSSRFSEDSLASPIVDRASNEESPGHGSQKPLAIVRPQRKEVKESLGECPEPTQTGAKARVGEEKKDISLYDFDDDDPASPVTSSRFNKSKPVSTSSATSAGVGSNCNTPNNPTGVHSGTPANCDPRLKGAPSPPIKGKVGKGSSSKAATDQSNPANRSKGANQAHPPLPRHPSTSNASGGQSAQLQLQEASHRGLKHRDEDKMDCDLAPSNPIGSLPSSTKPHLGPLDLESDSGISTFRSDGASWADWPPEAFEVDGCLGRGGCAWLAPFERLAGLDWSVAALLELPLPTLPLMGGEGAPFKRGSQLAGVPLWTPVGLLGVLQLDPTPAEVAEEVDTGLDLLKRLEVTGEAGSSSSKS